MTKSTVEVLRDAKALLETKGWTQRSWARNADGTGISAKSTEATCYCGLGAVAAASSEELQLLFGSPVTAALDRAAGGLFERFNDSPGRTLPEVLAKFDEAIATEEAKLAEVSA